MAYVYDVHYEPRQEIGRAETISRLQFKNDGSDLFATVSATFEKHVIDINFLQKKMVTDHFNKRMIQNIRTGKGNNRTKMEKEFAKRQTP